MLKECFICGSSNLRCYPKGCLNIGYINDLEYITLDVYCENCRYIGTIKVKLIQVEDSFKMIN